MNKETIIQHCKNSNSLDSLAEKLGGNVVWDDIEAACPGFEKLIERNILSVEIEKAKEAGDEVKAKTLRKDLIRLTGEIFNLGLNSSALKTKKSSSKDKGSLIESVVQAEKSPKVDQEALEQKKALKKAPKEKAPKAVKNSKVLETGEWEVMNKGEIQCEPARDMVIGYVPGVEYLSRRMVFVKLIPGLFGDGVVCRDTLKRYTIHKGIINHSDVRLEEPPSTYWAVMDAMSELGTFTKSQVVELAVKRMVEGGCRDNNDNMGSGCGIAYDVLKTHQTHPTKKKSGMTHICDDGIKTASGEKSVSIRGRRAEETLEFFSEQKKEMKKSLKNGKPLRTVCLKDPV